MDRPLDDIIRGHGQSGKFHVSLDSELEAPSSSYQKKRRMAKHTSNVLNPLDLDLETFAQSQSRSWKTDRSSRAWEKSDSEVASSNGNRTVSFEPAHLDLELDEMVRGWKTDTDRHLNDELESYWKRVEHFPSACKDGQGCQKSDLSNPARQDSSSSQSQTEQELLAELAAREAKEQQLAKELESVRARAEAAEALANDAKKSKAKGNLVCAITGELFQDPVICADGHSYERAAIEDWFRRGKRTSPLTNECLQHQHLIPNHALRGAVEELSEEKSGLKVLP